MTFRRGILQRLGIYSRLAAGIAMMIIISGCGQKGPLYLPQDQPPPCEQPRCQSSNAPVSNY